MIDPTLHAKFVMALTSYDNKQSKNKFYNRYAFGQYLERLKEVEIDIGNGAPVVEAIHAGFFEPLNSLLVKVYAKHTGDAVKPKKDIHTGWSYSPVVKIEE